MSFSYPVQSNSTDCRLDTCSNGGLCNAIDGWCDCPLNYDPLVACATPFHHAVGLGPKVAVLCLGFVFYLAMMLLFVSEIIHVVHHRAKRTWHNPSTWALLMSIAFLCLRLVAIALNSVDFTREDASYGVAALLVNTVAISVWGCVFVLCATAWLGILQRVQNLGDLSPAFWRCRMANLILMGVGIPCGVLCAVLNGVGIGPPGLLGLVSQLFAAIGVVIPTLITIGCLIAVRGFIEQVRRRLAMEEGPHHQAKRDLHVFRVLLAKTRLVVALVVLIVVIFIWVFGIAATIDGALPGVVLLKLFAQVVTDALVVPIFWLFAQKYFVGPRVSWSERCGSPAVFFPYLCCRSTVDNDETPASTASTTPITSTASNLPSET